MKQADAAQASNLGQALAPAIAGRFQVLTQRRYDAVQLSAQLGTEGVLVGGAARPASRLSVGTREQLSTLYRLALAEYLQTTFVLDDQLVQSDDSRMDWFRALLNEKAQSFRSSFSPVDLVTTLQRHRWYPTVRAFMKTRIMGSSERSILGRVPLGRRK